MKSIKIFRPPLITDPKLRSADCKSALAIAILCISGGAGLIVQDKFTSYLGYLDGSTTNLMEATIANLYNSLIFNNLHVNAYNININDLIY